MSADNCLAFYGVRFEVSQTEVESLEDRTHLLIQQARRGGLQHYWVNVGAPDVKYLVFIGSKLAALGIEGVCEAALSDTQLLGVMQETRTKLKAAGFRDKPSLHFQWLPDV